MIEYSRALPTGDAAHSPVVMRTSWPRIIAVTLVLPVGAAAGSLLAFALDPPVGEHISFTGPMAVLAGRVAVVSVIGAWLQHRNRLVLSEGQLTLRTGWRDRVLRAADIQAVTLERAYGSRTLRLWLDDGSCRSVVAVGRTQGLFRQNFDRDYHLVGEWWLANRGPHWQPRTAFRQSPAPLTFNWNPGN